MRQGCVAGGGGGAAAGEVERGSRFTSVTGGGQLTSDTSSWLEVYQVTPALRCLDNYSLAVQGDIFPLLTSSELTTHGKRDRD